MSDGLCQGRLLSEQAVGSPDRKRTHKTVEPGRRVGAEDEEGGVGLHVDPGAAADGVEPPHRDAALVAEAEPEPDDVQHRVRVGRRALASPR